MRERESNDGQPETKCYHDLRFDVPLHLYWPNEEDWQENEHQVDKNVECSDYAPSSHSVAALPVDIAHEGSWRTIH
jgi:hypothetical protein